MMTIAASDGLKLFIPQVYDIVWSLIILVIVALFFHKFFMPKFNAIFDERAAKIEGNIAKAEQSKKDADAAKSKYEAQLSTARVEASRFVTTPVPKLPTSSPTHAPRGVRRRPDHRQRAALHRVAAAAGAGLLKGEVGTLATALAGKILGAKLESDDVQSSMIDKMIDDLDTNDKK